MDIRCRKTNCKFNDRHTCRAKEIKVGCDDICKTYNEGKRANVEASKEIFKNKKMFSPHRDTKNMEIFCNNDCLLNCSGKCRANGITVNDIKGKPECMTYLKK